MTLNCLVSYRTILSKGVCFIKSPNTVYFENCNCNTTTKTLPDKVGAQKEVTRLLNR